MPAAPKLMNLTIKQRLACQYLATGATRTEAAKKLRLDPTTLSKWRQNPAFEDHLNRLLCIQDQQVTQALYGLKLKAVERLSKLLDASPAIALRAVDLVLSKTLPPLPQRGAEESPQSRAWAAMQKELQKIAEDSKAQETTHAQETA